MDIVKMEKEIRELKLMFVNSALGRHYSDAECALFARLAIEGGYKHKKCFNADHELGY